MLTEIKDYNVSAYLYRMIQEELPPLMELISEDILSKIVI
jgi:hypothetical protein